MKIGVPKESKVHEYRVSMPPGAVKKMIAAGHDVIVQQGAGQDAGFPDEAYAQAGAQLVPTIEDVFQQARLIVKVKEPLLNEIELLRPDHILFTYLHLAAAPEIAAALIKSGCTAIAYETVTDDAGRLPLLVPMSIVAGRMSAQAAARCLEREYGGKGMLMSGLDGVAPADVLILGGGTVGRNAAAIAHGMGASVTVFDKYQSSLDTVEQQFGSQVRTVLYTEESLRAYLGQADVIIGAALVAGAQAPKLLWRDDLQCLEPGTVLVDVAIDQGGCFESSHPTTHAEPSYVDEGIVHYCVTNMPGAVPRTSTLALSGVTLPYILELADKGVDKVHQENKGLANGINIMAGEICHPGVAAALRK